MHVFLQLKQELNTRTLGIGKVIAHLAELASVDAAICVDDVYRDPLTVATP